jgi:predicted amidophosphoribosyltransferase
MVWSSLLPCPGCGRRATGRLGACPRCWAAIDADLGVERRRASVAARAGPSGGGGRDDPVREGSMVALGPYRGRLGRLVRAAKYRPSSALLDALGARLGSAVRERWPGAEGWLVVPVPPDAGRRRRRGHDHAARLAAALAGSAPPPRPTVLAALTRRRPTPPQSRVPWAAREANLAGAIALRGPSAPLPRGARVLLVDDISTSGATLRACRAVLLAGGAAEVRAAVVARAR